MIDVAVDRVVAVKVDGEWFTVADKSLVVEELEVKNEVGITVVSVAGASWVGVDGYVYTVPWSQVQALKSKRD